VRRKSTPYTGLAHCEYCNIHRATHQLVCGKLCCSSTAGNCKEVRRKAGSKISASRRTEVTPGVTNAHLIANKISENKSKNIDPVTGLNKHKSSAKKVAENKANNIDPITGLNTHQSVGLKRVEWSKTPEGKEWNAARGKEISDKLNTVDPNTGLSESRRRAKVMVETKLNNIDEHGLNSFDRAHWVGGKGGFIDGVYYQSSNEKRFLELMQVTGTIQNIRRGKKISYYVNNEERCYLPDYILNETTLFEIKSTYTMFGKDNQFLQNNIAKLLAAKESGYNVYVVIDDKTIALDSFIGTVSHLLEG
jgi:hypothetical protein